MDYKIIVTTNTWIKDNYDLFDYNFDHSTDFITNVHRIKSDGILIRRENNTEYIRSDKKQLQIQNKHLSNDSQLIQLQFQNGQLQVVVSVDESKLWAVVNNEENNFRVQKNDIIKLGKKQFKVLQISDKLNSQSIFNIESHYKKQIIGESFLSDNNQSITMSNNRKTQDQKQLIEDRKMCRICLGTSTSSINPLISICKCKGSARFIHYQCVQQWINNRLQPKYNQEIIEINAKSVKCELCLTYFPPFIKFDDIHLNLYTFKELDFNKFIIIEDTENNVIYILNCTEKNKFQIGRQQNSNIKLTEITVSRTHAILTIEQEGDIYINDLKSKFGTLLKINQSFYVDPKQQTSLQNGRTMINIQMIKKVSFIKELYNKICCKDRAPVANYQQKDSNNSQSNSIMQIQNEDENMNIVQQHSLYVENESDQQLINFNQNNNIQENLMQQSNEYSLQQQQQQQYEQLQTHYLQLLLQFQEQNQNFIQNQHLQNQQEVQVSTNLSEQQQQNQSALNEQIIQQNSSYACQHYENQQNK